MNNYNDNNKPKKSIWGIVMFFIFFFIFTSDFNPIRIILGLAFPLFFISIAVIFFRAIITSQRTNSNHSDNSTFSEEEKYFQQKPYSEEEEPEYNYDTFSYDEDIYKAREKGKIIDPWDIKDEKPPWEF